MFGMIGHKCLIFSNLSLLIACFAVFGSPGLKACRECRMHIFSWREDEGGMPVRKPCDKILGKELKDLRQTQWCHRKA